MEKKNLNEKKSKKIIFSLILIILVIAIFVLIPIIANKNIKNLAEKCNKNNENACKELETMCDEDNKDACYELATIYSKKGIKTWVNSEDGSILFNSAIARQYLEKADFYMKKACKLGHNNACLILKLNNEIEGLEK